jgi:DNA-binding response OmpR family regulator
MTDPVSLLLVGKLRPERKRSLSGMAVAADLQTVAMEDTTEALAWLDSNAPGCLLVDSGVSRVDKLIGKLRSNSKLSHVPVFALVSAPDDLWLEQYFGWGGDDVVHADAGTTLLERLRAVPRQAPPLCNGRRVVIADPDVSRVEALARVFRLAGFEVHSATERKSLQSILLLQRPAVAVANTALGDLPELIAKIRSNGSKTAFLVLAPRREFDAQQQALGAVERCAVIGPQMNPWQVLYRANQLSRPEGAEQRGEPRRAFGSFVLFRPAGSDVDDVGIAYNLSSRGMYVRTFAPVTSEDVWLEWRVPQDATRVRIEGRVAFRQAALSDANRAACPMGFGVEFRDYLGGARKHLARALEILDAAALKSSSTRPSSMPPAESSEPATQQASPAQTAAAARSPSNPPLARPLTLPPGVEKLAEPKPLSLMPNGSLKPLVPTMLGIPANVSGGANETASAEPNTGASERPPAPATQGAKTSDSKSLPSPLIAPPPPTRAESVSVDAKRFRGPPRPAGSPVAESKTAAAPTTTSAASEVKLDVSVRRFDTLRDAIPFDDQPENTDPVADRQLLEDAPTSSEPTEIRVGGIASLESDPSLRVAAQSATIAELHARAVPEIAPALTQRATAPSAIRHDTDPSSERVDELFGSEEQVTTQWQGGALVGARAQATPTQAKPTRRWPMLFGVAFAIGAVLGIVAYLRPTLVAGRGQDHAARVHTPAAEQRLAPHEIANPTQPEVPAAVPSALPSSTLDAGSVGPDASNDADAATLPWATPDDGAPREGYPPIEESNTGSAQLLADQYGYLIVRFPESAFLYSKNIAMGETNRKVATPCGEKVIRVGVGEKPAIWLSNETRLRVACRRTTTVLLERLPDVVVPPGTKRPIAPGPTRKRKRVQESGASERSDDNTPAPPEPAARPVSQEPESQ